MKATLKTTVLTNTTILRLRNKHLVHSIAYKVCNAEHSNIDNTCVDTCQYDHAHKISGDKLLISAPTAGTKCEVIEHNPDFAEMLINIDNKLITIDERLIEREVKQ
jgi:hypothetical protein